MLDGIHPWGRPLRPALASRVHAHVVREAWELNAYYGLRREVFVGEQALFQGSDRDEQDGHATPIVAVSEIAGMPDEVVGVVRIYASSDDLWYGGRLAVRAPYRRRGAVGGELIRVAVSTAHARGCRRFFATVQLDNVRYFERHHFRALEPVRVCERPHWLMEADLGAFPAELAAASGRAA